LVRGLSSSANSALSVHSVLDSFFFFIQLFNFELFNLFSFSSLLTPLECADPQNASVSLLECAVPKKRPCKSFRMRRSKKKRGEGVERPGPI
jgi:hypothetical protein